MSRRQLVTVVAVAATIVATAIGIAVSTAGSVSGQARTAASATRTPIKHLVVIYGENISFDHYFGTYPHAANPANEPAFAAKARTPRVRGLSPALRYANPNVDNPVRLDRSQALTCDQNHGYTAEQNAFDRGLMDRFVQNTAGRICLQTRVPNSPTYGSKATVMDYYDGNTVTALWNYAQHFTLDDNAYGTQFGPSTPGAINLISGNTHGAVAKNGLAGVIANGTDISDADPYYDLCSNPNQSLRTADPSTGVPEPGGGTIAMSGTNIGDLLNAHEITWGWFQGGFTPSSRHGGRPVCGSSHKDIAGISIRNYVPHHEPFQYYASTANPYHNAPSSVSRVGHSDPAGTAISQAVNHQYDLTWFNRALRNGDMPSVSFLKAPAYQDAHAGYSDPLDEQRFLVGEINRIESSKFWRSTAIVVTYDDSDGWYDHVMGRVVRRSLSSADTLTGSGRCGAGTTAPAQNDRCGVGPRLPLLVISPWAKTNHVDHTFSEQASILRFIEDNWGLGRLGHGSADATAGTLKTAFDFNQSYGHAPAIILNSTTGEISKTIYPKGQVVLASSSSPAKSVPGLGHLSTGKLARLGCRHRIRSNVLRLHCRTKSNVNARSLVRVRLYRAHHLIDNVSHLVRHHRARFRLPLAQPRAGRYRLVITFDLHGRVSARLTHLRVG